MGIAPEPSGGPGGIGRGISLVWNHRFRGLTYPYVRISSPSFSKVGRTGLEEVPIVLEEVVPTISKIRLSFEQ